MTAVAVSVLIRCRDEVRHIGAVVDGVLAQTGAPPFEIVALDSGSTDGTLDVLARRPVRMEQLAPATFSFGGALNQGAALARGALVVYLSAHCPPCSRGWLAALVAPFADAAVVATFGRQVPARGVNPIEARTQAWMFPATPPAGVLFSNANAAVRRAAVLARPFDETIPAAEDHLWAAERAPGERIVYVPEAAVVHSHPMGWREWRYRFYINGLASEYVRRRGIAAPWDAGPATPRRGGSAAAFAALVGDLARDGELRALAQLPAYALARAVRYGQGRRDGRRRWGGA